MVRRCLTPTPVSIDRQLRQVAERYPLLRRLFCGLCDRHLVSIPLRVAPSVVFRRTDWAGCGIPSRVGTLRFLLQRIQERDPAAVEEPGQARIRDALPQLPDDQTTGCSTERITCVRVVAPRRHPRREPSSPTRAPDAARRDAAEVPPPPDAEPQPSRLRSPFAVAFGIGFLLPVPVVVLGLLPPAAELLAPLFTPGVALLRPLSSVLASWPGPVNMLLASVANGLVFGVVAAAVALLLGRRRR